MSEQGKPQTSSSDPATIGALHAIVSTLQGMEERAQKRIPKTIDEIVVVTPYDPKGSLGGERDKKLKWEHVFQNGSPLHPAMLHDEEIDLLNQFKRSGRYNKGKWVVIVKKHERTLNILYPNKTVENRMDLAREVREGKPTQSGSGFAGMLQNILIEEEARVERKKKGLDEFDDED